MLKIRSISQAVQKLSSGKENETFGYCDLDFDPMTFTSEPDIDMVVTYLHAKNQVNRSSGSKVITRIHTHTHTHRGKTFTYPHSRVVTTTFHLHIGSALETALHL